MTARGALAMCRRRPAAPVLEAQLTLADIGDDRLLGLRLADADRPRHLHLLADRLGFPSASRRRATPSASAIWSASRTTPTSCATTQFRRSLRHDRRLHDLHRAAHLRGLAWPGDAGQLRRARPGLLSDGLLHPDRGLLRHRLARLADGHLQRRYPTASPTGCSTEIGLATRTVNLLDFFGAPPAGSALPSPGTGWCW